MFNPDDHCEIKGSARESGETKKDEKSKNADHIECLINIKDNCSEKVDGECSKYYQRHHLPLCDKKNMIILIYFVYLD